MLTLWHSSEKLHELIEMLFVTRNTFYGTRYLSHCSTGFVLNPLFVNWVTSLNLGSLEVIGHVTIGTADGPFLLVCWRQVTISHGCRDIEHQTFQGHHLDPFGSRDVIGHVTIGSTGGPFLLVIRWHNVPILHCCQDIEPQTFRGHDLDPFGSRDVIGHVTIGTADGHFLLVIHWHNVPISHRCRDIKHHNLDNHIPIVNTLENNFGDLGGGLG